MARSGMETGGFAALITAMGETERRLRAAGMGSDVDRVLKGAADPILEDMRKQASEDPAMRSGDLHDSINAYRARSKNPDNIKRTIGVHRRDWDKEDYYPAYVEFGHGGPGPARPHPFVRPAYDMHADEAYDAIRRGLNELLEQIRK